MRRLAGLALLALSWPIVLWGAQPQFWRIEGARDFLEGTTEGLSVDSQGRARLGVASSVIQDTESPYVWCLARDAKGVLYAGTGNDGKVFRMESGASRLYFDASELEVHALAAGPDGRVYIGTSPDGKIYAVDANGSKTTFFDPPEKYIWALAFDPAGNLLVATGAEAKLYRVDKSGSATTLLTSADTNIVSLAIDPKGNVYAGSAPGGIIYRVDTASKVFVIHDAPFREVKALEIGRDGSVYAAVVDGADKEAPREAPNLSPPSSSSAIGTAEVTVMESFSLLPAAPAALPTPKPAEAARSSAKGAVLRVLPTGEVDTLWSSKEETPHALLASDDGVLLGTGDSGKLYRVRDDRTWTMLAAFPAEQLTALHGGAAGTTFVATSNPGRVYSFEARLAERGTFTSKVKDTETVSSWGRLRWEASVPAGGSVQIQTRSGNTNTPDSTWSAWSAPYTRELGDPVTSERARFLQVRASLTGKDGGSPVLDSISTAYLQRNLRPRVTSITVHPPGEVFQKPLTVTGEIEILGLETDDAPEVRQVGQTSRTALPPITNYSRRLYQRGLQTFSWTADDPNNDPLVYDIYYRALRDTRFRLLRKGLTEGVLAWDTSTVPNGRYVMKVVASDTPGNPESLALLGEKESVPFDVDNTPPLVSATLAAGSPPRVIAVVKDDSSIVRKAEYSADGGRWQEVHPTDGINDALEETYEIPVANIPGAGPHLIVVRATDLLGNIATARVEVK